MAERPWMPIYWGDYARDTMHLTTWQHGCYLLLIWAYWVRGGPLPNDPEYLAGVCRTTQDKLARYGKPVLAMFTCTDGLLVHKRVEKELLKVSVRSAKASASAKQRARVSESQPESESKTPPSVQETNVSFTDTPSGGNGHTKPKPEKRGKRLPEDWQPSPEAIAYCRKELGATTEILDREYQAFRDWALSATGPASRKLDWDRAFVNWIRRVMHDVRQQEARERRWAERRGTAH